MSMLKHRLIPNIILNNGNVVQSKNFRHTNVIGNAITAVDFFNSWAVDEICILEMIGTYERIATQLNKEIILCPTDYPYLYANCDPTYIFLGNKKHWRKTEQSLGTFLISKTNLNIYWENLLQFASGKDNPAEIALHKIYEKEPCFSPIPSLAIHCANINSIYGISPNINWQEIWDNNKI